MTFGTQINGGAAAADTERSAFLGKVQPEAGKDAEAFTKSESHSFANLSHRVQSDGR